MFCFFSADRSPFQRRTTTTLWGQGIAQQSHHRCCVPSSNGAITDRWTWSGPRCLLRGRGGSGVEVGWKFFLNFCKVQKRFAMSLTCLGLEQVSQFFRETVLIEWLFMAGDFEIDSLFSNPRVKKWVVFQMFSGIMIHHDPGILWEFFVHQCMMEWSEIQDKDRCQVSIAAAAHRIHKTITTILDHWSCTPLAWNCWDHSDLYEFISIDHIYIYNIYMYIYIYIYISSFHLSVFWP